MRQATEGKTQAFVDIVNALIEAGWQVKSYGRRDEEIHDADGRFLGTLHQENNGGNPYIRYQFPRAAFATIIVTSVAELVNHFTAAPHIHTDRGAWLYAMFCDRFPIKWSNKGVARIGDAYLRVNESNGWIYVEKHGLTHAFNGSTGVLVNLLRDSFDMAMSVYGD